MLPNFIIIGAAKAGTTSLYNYLNQHPEIYMSPIKEPKFFWLEQEKIDLSVERTKIVLNKYIDNIEDYEKLFEGVRDEKAVGEASSVYITIPEVPKRIKKYIPHAKLIVILRDPVERARSAHSWNVQIGIEPILSFNRAVKAELSPGNWRNNLGPGLYYKQLQYYLNTFEKNQIGIFFYEELINNPIAIMQEIFRFLGVDTSFIPNTAQKYNVSVVPKYGFIYSNLKNPNPILKVIKKILPSSISQKSYNMLMKWNSTRPQQVSPELRKELIEFYKDDILKLQEFINGDLSKWLQ